MTIDGSHWVFYSPRPEESVINHRVYLLIDRCKGLEDEKTEGDEGLLRH